MTDAHAFMAFGVLVAFAGLFLTGTAKAGQGQTSVKLLGAEITLAAAGGIVVTLFGVVTFSIPTLVSAIHRPSASSSSPASALPAPAAAIRTGGVSISDIQISTNFLSHDPAISEKQCTKRLQQAAVARGLAEIKGLEGEGLAYVDSGVKVYAQCQYGAVVLATASFSLEDAQKEKGRAESMIFSVMPFHALW